MIHKIDSNSQEYKDCIETMRRFTKSEKGFVGIFWYDSKKDRLIGIARASIETTFDNQNGSKMIDLLHKDMWKNISELFPDKNSFMDKGKFIVKIGDWLNKYPQVKELIVKEFELKSEPDFDIDKHRDLWRGESDLFI
jgi:hypothetical protein